MNRLERVLDAPKHLTEKPVKKALCGIVFIMLMASLIPVSGLAQPVDIGSQRELFVDYHLIERLDGVSLKLHTPISGGKALVFDKPWEGRWSTPLFVFKDGDIFRMYYRGMRTVEVSDTPKTCYAESTDGIKWTRPNLGITEFQGSTNNNIITNLTIMPFVDIRPGTPEDERFKAVYCPDDYELRILVSADGIHWQDFYPKPVIQYPKKGATAFDTITVIFWSEAENCYVLYTRLWSSFTKTEEERGNDISPSIRQIRRYTSDDLIHWSSPEPMKYSDEDPTEDLYTNATQPYFRAPHIYFSYPMRFFPGRNIRTEEEFEQEGTPIWNRGISDGIFLTSRGGNRYDRTFPEAFIRPGLDRDNWFARSQIIPVGIVPVGKSEMSLYCSRNYSAPSAYLERLRLRLDGMASAQEGKLLTKTIIFAGDELELNYSTSASGSIRVEIQEENGVVLKESKTVIGNEINGVVSWTDGGSLNNIQGKPVRICFTMFDADLYSYRFK